MNKYRHLFVASFLTAIFFLSGQAMAAVPDERLLLTSGSVQNTLLELFTSDANPNGNPALKWMSSLKEEESDGTLWKKVVPIAMHVQVWDVPGYKDSFGRQDYNDRLLAYKMKWNASKVYCPTMIVNGLDWSGWSRQQPIPSSTAETGVLIADGTKREGYFQVDFNPASQLVADGFTVHAALLAFGLRSKPSDGKNMGKILQHDFISIIYRTQDLRLNSGVLTSSIELARPKGIRVERYAVVFWVTKKDDPLPIQAVGGYLPT